MQTAISEIRKSNTGLVLDNKIHDWVFLGSSSSLDNKILIPSGIWSAYKTANEMQAGKYFDTWNCVAFSACNAVEVFFKYLIAYNLISRDGISWLNQKGYMINGEVNFSDRHLGHKAGTKVGIGNTASNVANAMLVAGLVPEKLWAFDKDMRDYEYYIKTPSAIDNLGLEFNKRFKVNFEVVYSHNFREALKYSPIQVFVNAWHKNEDGLYFNPDKSVNHAALRLRSDEEQIFDHYKPFIKSFIKSYYYLPVGFKYTVFEKISDMSIETFLEKNDLLFVRNVNTGQFGRIMQGMLMVVNTNDRGTLLLLDEAVRKNGRGLSQGEWDLLPKKNF